jgi:hypothetical protein
LRDLEKIVFSLAPVGFFSYIHCHAFNSPLFSLLECQG